MKSNPTGGGGTDCGLVFTHTALMIMMIQFFLFMVLMKFSNSFFKMDYPFLHKIIQFKTKYIMKSICTTELQQEQFRRIYIHLFQTKE